LHQIFIKQIPISRIVDPTKYIRKNNFSFAKLFTLEAKSLSNNPNACDVEDCDVEKSWNSGLNSDEINLRLEEKRKKYFSEIFRYNLIIGKFNQKSVQWKITFLNSNINSRPQSETIKKENIERFILKL
jgi:hypothetical protein